MRLCGVIELSEGEWRVPDRDFALLLTAELADLRDNLVRQRHELLSTPPGSSLFIETPSGEAASGEPASNASR